MRALAALGYAVTFTAPEAMEADGTLEDAGVIVCGAPFYASVEDVLRRQSGCFDIVYLCGVDVASPYLALARQYTPRGRMLLSVFELRDLRLQRQAPIESAAELVASANRMRLIECMAAWSADAVIVPSAAGVATLRRSVPPAVRRLAQQASRLSMTRRLISTTMSA